MMRKYAWLILLLNGCGSVLTDLAGGEDVPVPPGRVFTPGVYTGTNYCRFELTAGDASRIWVHTVPVGITINSAGDMIVNGGLVRVGSLTSDDFELFVVSGIVESVIEADNRLVFDCDARLTFECANSCASARNGDCEEGDACAIGEDCDDCGALILDGCQVSTAKRLPHTRIELTTSAQLSDAQGWTRFDGQCWTTVSR